MCVFFFFCFCFCFCLFLLFLITVIAFFFLIMCVFKSFMFLKYLISHSLNSAVMHDRNIPCSSEGSTLSAPQFGLAKFEPSPFFLHL